MLQELTQNNELAKHETNQYRNDFYKNILPHFQDQNTSSLKELIQELEAKLRDLQLEQISDNPQNLKIPLYRFLILQGHQYQNYPSEVKLIIKERETNLQRNVIKWIAEGNPLLTLNKKIYINCNLPNGQGHSQLQ